MTEYVITEVGRHQWLVFADRQGIAFCASENEAVTVMNEHSARSSRSRGSSSGAIWFGREPMTASGRDIPATGTVSIEMPAWPGRRVANL